jgi:hypothetical protein
MSPAYLELKSKRLPAIHDTFRPCPSAVPMNDALDIRQPDARALERLLTVQTLKHAKQFSRIFRIKTRAVVANKNHRLTIAKSGTDFNFSLGTSAGELHRIGNQILTKLVCMVCEELENGEAESETKRAALKNQMIEIEKKLARHYELIESNALNVADVAPRLRELNGEKEALATEISGLNANTPRAANFPKPSQETVIAYVEDLRSTLNEGSIMHRKAFLNSFIRRINVKDSEAEIEYTCPIGLGGNRRNEVLSMARIGSRGRTRNKSIAEVSFPSHLKLKNLPSV